MRKLVVCISVWAATLLWSVVHAATPVDVKVPSSDGASLFVEHCAACHNGSIPRAPHVITFNMMSSDTLLEVMNEGVMKRQAAVLSPDQRVAVADYLSESGNEALPVNMCSPRSTTPSPHTVPVWNGWGGDASNQRYVSSANSGIGKADLAHLKLQWVFAYPGASRARSQPLVHQGVVYVGSQSGAVYALDLDSGCAHWIYQAGAEVRNGPSLVQVEGQPQPLLVFGDFRARVHGVDSLSGTRVWMTDVSTHPDATITGSVKVFDGRIYVPISSSEWATAADPGYPCCTFRGSVAALDARTGELIWNTFVIPETPRDTGQRNAAGATRLGPSGAPVWNSPAIDAERGLLYVGTGEAYTSPASRSSDAVIAMKLTDGSIVWRKQLLSGDAWNMACFIGGGANCPEENGPDLDIGAATILWGDERQTLLLVGQKSGDVYALNPDKQGDIVWQQKLGRGGFAGGVHWGMSTDSDTLFVPIADTDFLNTATGEPFPGIHALDPASGAVRWYSRSQDHCSAASKPACDPGMSAAVTSTDDLLFAGGFDGLLRAYDSNSGEVLWVFNTADEFEAVNGDLARGGSIESDGPVLAERHILVNSGYQFGGRMPGNALLVFAPVTTTD